MSLPTLNKIQKNIFIKYRVHDTAGEAADWWINSGNTLTGIRLCFLQYNIPIVQTAFKSLISLYFIIG